MGILPQWKALLVSLVMVADIGVGSQIEDEFDVFKYVDPFIGTAKGGMFSHFLKCVEICY